MGDFLGLGVLNVKANVSCDGIAADWQNAAMVDRMTETEEKAAFIKRTRDARLARFNRQKPICIILGIDQGTYKQYESRTPLPHRFIPKFCAATGVEVEWLLTGEGKGPAVVPLPLRKPQNKARRNVASRVA